MTDQHHLIPHQGTGSTPLQADFIHRWDITHSFTRQEKIHFIFSSDFG
jgi:hypothetical protein